MLYMTDHGQNDVDPMQCLAALHFTRHPMAEYNLQLKLSDRSCGVASSTVIHLLSHP